MEYAPQLTEKLKELGIQKDQILFLVMEESFLNEVKSGAVHLEHKKATNFLLSRLFKKDRNSGKYRFVKKKTHFLFQSGYKSNGRRLLVEFPKWELNGEIFPSNSELTSDYSDQTNLDLFIGKVIFDSAD